MKKWGIVCLVLGLLFIAAGIFTSDIYWAIFTRYNGTIAMIGATSESMAQTLYSLYFSRFFFVRLIGYLLTALGTGMLIAYRKKAKNS